MSMIQLEQLLRQTLPDARIEAVALPECETIRLGLINEDYQTGPLDPEVMRAVIREPAYWAFCWGSGLALARYLLANPDWVRGRTVVDLGSGSGVAGIAAALAGAAQVIACDTDPHARLATERNAALNEVEISVQSGLPHHCDLLLMADVLYDRSNLPLLTLAQSTAAEVLVADSRVTDLPDPSYREIARIDALTIPNLGEFDEFRTAHLFHWRTPRDQPD
ncbi:MAG: methyltransferase [Gammaproteobacteria bacterium]|nr:MAG: methyltransferase [Gammaproteobacteria bacterium]